MIRTATKRRNEFVADLYLEQEFFVVPDSQDFSSRRPAGLRKTIDDAKAISRLPMSELSVLTNSNDPYRLDTPGNHVAGSWLARHFEKHKMRRPIHLRGAHYVLGATGDVIRPNGKVYVNNEECWTWVVDYASKAARWLGYIPWSDIRDERNAPPELHLPAEPATTYVPTSVSFYAWADFHTDVSEPSIYIGNIHVPQRYQFCLIGEKSSLEDVLGPIASTYHATLPLPTGEVSATMTEEIINHMVLDGRPAVVFYFSDCDPSGYQMPTSFSRKAQAFITERSLDLDLRVYHTALTPDQVREHGLPDNPIKESERRGEDWVASMGVEQTEIDALQALKPGLLRRIALDAIAPFYDYTLSDRVSKIYRERWEAANAALAEQADAEKIEEMRQRVGRRLAEMKEEVANINAEMQAAVEKITFRLPKLVMPEPVLKPEPGGEVFSSRWDWLDATIRMKRRKRYQDDE